MADHKVFNLQNPEYWRHRKKEDDFLDDEPDSSDSSRERENHALPVRRRPSAPEQDALDEDEEEAEAPDPQARRRQILHILIMLGAVAALIFLIVIQSRNRTYDTASYRKIEDLVGQEDTRYYSLGSNIVACSRDGASCISTSGSMIWNVTYEMQEPMTARSGNVMAIGDYNGSEIHIVNDTRILGSVDTSMPIRGLTVAENGEVAAVLNDSDVTWIYLFDSQGNTIAYFKTTMGQSGYPLAVAVSPNGEVVGVSHLTMGSTAANTSIAFYNFGDVGQSAAENNVSGFNYDDEVFPFITYMNESTCAAVSDRRLAFFINANRIPDSGTNIMFDAQVQGVFANSNYIVILFPDTSGQEQYVMRVYNTSGTMISSIPFTMDYTSIQLCSDRIVINNDQVCQIYNVDGTLKYEGSFQKAVKAVIPSRSSTNRLTIVTANTLEQMTLE